MPSNSATETSAAPVPQVSVDEKWDHSLETFMRKSTIAFAIGILPALLLARSSAARGAIVALCTGFGGGVAYGEAKYLFDYNVMFEKRNLIRIELSGSGEKDSKAIQ